MSSGIKIDGIDEVILKLRNIAEVVPDHARRTMHRVADKIVTLAKEQAPVDKHNLEDSIHKEVKRGDDKRLQIDIVAGGEVNGVNVDQYVVQVHEHYSSMKPGPGTLAKMASTSAVVGEKFLTRAYDKYEGELEKMMITDVNKDVKL